MKRIDRVSRWESHYNDRNGMFYINVYYLEKLVNVIGSCKTNQGTLGLWLKYAKKPYVYLWHEENKEWNKWDKAHDGFYPCEAP